MKLIPMLSWLFVIFGGYFYETSALPIVSKIDQNIDEYYRDLADEIKEEYQQNVLKKLSEYPLADGSNVLSRVSLKDFEVSVEEMAAALEKFDARKTKGDKKFLNRTRAQLRDDLFDINNNHSSAFHVIQHAADDSVKFYEKKMDEEMIDMMDRREVQRAHKQFKSEAIELFQAKIEESNFNEIKTIEQLIEIFKRRLERKIDITLTKFTLSFASFNAYQTAANESLTYYYNKMNEFKNITKKDEFHPEFYSLMHNHFKAEAFKQFQEKMAGPSYEASAPYFERYIEQEIEHFNEIPRLGMMLVKAMQKIFPEFFSDPNSRLKS